MPVLGVVQVALILAAAYPIAVLASWVDAHRTPAAATADSPAAVPAVEGAPAVETPALVGRGKSLAGAVTPFWEL
jgi:3-deoxy-D-manno-octulosonic acid (KDO) 8-phosphate synthase